MLKPFQWSRVSKFILFTEDFNHYLKKKHLWTSWPHIDLICVATLKYPILHKRTCDFVFYFLFGSLFFKLFLFFSVDKTAKAISANTDCILLFYDLKMTLLIKLASLSNPRLIQLWPEAALYSFLFNFHLPFSGLHIHFFSVCRMVRGGGY